MHEWTLSLCDCAGETPEEAEGFWEKLNKVPELLQEYAYFYEHQEFLCSYKIENFTLADILIWQMDHFRSRMDRLDNENRYNKNKLILETFRTMLEMRENPEKIMREFASETGTDLASGWTIG